LSLLFIVNKSMVVNKHSDRKQGGTYQLINGYGVATSKWFACVPASGSILGREAWGILR
jgi:hypothetical protein